MTFPKVRDALPPELRRSQMIGPVKCAGTDQLENAPAFLPLDKMLSLSCGVGVGKCHECLPDPRASFAGGPDVSVVVLPEASVGMET